MEERSISKDFQIHTSHRVKKPSHDDVMRLSNVVKHTIDENKVVPFEDEFSDVDEMLTANIHQQPPGNDLYSNVRAKQYELENTLIDLEGGNSFSELREMIRIQELSKEKK